jgi:hypothetical protein
MAVYTVSGLAAADVGDTGIYEMATGEILAADPWNKTFKDLQIPARYALLPGILEPPGIVGSITTSALDVTIASGTSWFAQGVYTLDDDYVVAVPDDATTRLYARSDGVISSDTTGFLASQYCILCDVIAADGVATIDITVQQRARYADPDNRFVTDTGGFMAQPSEISDSMVCIVPAGFQTIFYPPSAEEPFEVNGALIINGRAKTEAW